MVARSGLSILWVENGKKIFNRTSLSKCGTFATVSDKEIKAKIAAEGAFEEKGVSSVLAVFQFTEYQDFDSRKKKYKFCVFLATSVEPSIGKLLEKIKPVVARKKISVNMVIRRN